MTQARTKVEGPDRWLQGVGVGFVVAGTVVAILLAVAVPLLGLVLLVPMLAAAVVCGAGVLLRKRPATESLTLLRDGVAVFLAVGVLSLVLGLTVFSRSDVRYLGSVVVQRGTVTLADCDPGPTFGWHGYGRMSTCRGKAKWSGGAVEQVELRDSQLDYPDIGRTVPVARERLLTGTLLVTRDDGHPWLIAGLLFGTPLLVLAGWLALLVPAAVARPMRTDPVRRLRERRAEAGTYRANRSEELIRRRRGKVGFAQTRAVPGWVITGDLRRLRLVALVLIGGGLLTYLVRGTPELPGRAGIGTTIGALGGLLLVVSVQRIDRRRREAARIAEYGPDAADTLDSARERARRPRSLPGAGLGAMVGVVGFAEVRPVVNAITSSTPMSTVFTMALPALCLLAAAILLLVAASEDDRGWRGLMCSSVRAPMPDVAEELRSALTDRQLATVEHRF